MTEPAECLNLLDLPNELLLQIISLGHDISPEDIYNIALVSRRLLYLGLPLFLAAHGIRNPTEETLLYVLRWTRHDLSSARQPHVLSALNLLRSLTQIKYLKCFFQDPDTKSLRNTFQHMHHLPDAIQHVSRFIKRLEHIDHVDIYLVWDQYFILRTQKISDISSSDFKDWVKAFGQMLNYILERGCTSLTVQYDPSLLPAFHFRHSGKMHKAIAYLTRETEPSQLRWEFESAIGKDKLALSEIDLAARLSPSARTSKSITHLSVHSPALLLPPFINWTTSLIQTHHNLTSISFACITFQKDIWAVVLPAIAEAASTRLKELKFFHNCPHLESHDLLQFICCFPNLSILSIDRTFRARFQHFRPWTSRGVFSAQSHSSEHIIPRFVLLKKLRAPVELVSLLLGPPILPGHAIPLLTFPNLEELTVYPSSLLIHPPSYITSILHVNQLMEAVKIRPFSPKLLLSLDAQMEFTDFRPVARYIKNINHHGEFQRALWETLTEREIQQLTGRGPVPHIAFNHLTRLVLYKLYPQNPDQTPRSLCIWLKALFPCLERLTFTCRLDAHPQHDVTMDSIDIDHLIKELQELCPNIRHLVVGEKHFQQ